MAELSSDEVSHSDEVLDAAIAACPSASLLKRSIHRFDSAVVLACLETVENARKMVGDRSAEALEGFQSAQGAARPTPANVQPSSMMNGNRGAHGSASGGGT